MASKRKALLMHPGLDPGRDRREEVLNQVGFRGGSAAALNPPLTMSKKHGGDGPICVTDA